MVENVQMAAALSDCFHILKKAKEEKSINKLPSDQFKNVISCCQKLNATPNSLLPPLLTDLADIFLETLAECSLTFDNQILASTAFSLILNLIQEPLNISLLFSKNFIPAGTEPFQVKLSKNSELTITVVRPDVFKLCACSGLLQLGDSFWSSHHLNWNSLMFLKLFPLLETHCFQYTHLTTLSFKCLKTWLMKVNTSNKPSRKLFPEILLRIIKIILANWENPINGIREQNILLFEQFLLASETLPITETTNENRYLNPIALMDLVLTEQSWMMKSKYFMLSVLLPKNGTYKVLTNMGNDIVTGLLNSLCYSHLVSAGTDLYKVCLEDLSLESWQQVFLQPIILILTSKYSLQKQNLFNYWIPPTVKKFKLALQVIMDSVLEVSEKDMLLPVICCYKLGRKEGFENMQWQNISDSKFLSIALKHCDENIRSHAFAVVCVSSKSSLFPTDEEFELLQSFLEENINVDHTSLRHNMVGSFASFLCRVRDSCLQNLHSRLPDSNQPENPALNRSMDFLDWLYSFLKDNLEIGTNYQRRFTSLEIYKIVLSYFTEDSVPTLVQRRGSLKSDRQNVMKYATKVGKWGFTSDSAREMLLYCISDPSADVREAAATLLRTYFKINDHETSRFSDLYKKAVNLCSDSLFYCAESGALLVQVVTCLGYKHSGQGGLRSLGMTTKDERVSSSLLLLAQNQGMDLKEDLLKAASQGSPLHGVLRAIERLVLDKSSPEHNKLSEAERLKLITLLETTTQHLLQVLASSSSNISEFAPSFCEMGEAIEGIVKDSSIITEDFGKGHLSPAYQLVLNCIWLNLRVCCSVASGLVASYGAGTLGASEAWRCTDIVISVLKSCRHKGALEAAGTSLALCVRSLTSAGLLVDLQKCLCDAMTSLAERPLTTSTRGAGFVIMIHKAVAADSRPSKPLLEMFVESLVTAVETGKGDVCQALQLLAVLIQDSSLTQDMAKHLHNLAILSISSIASTNYPIRNGGLHLFGAVVPKLVGQRKRQDDDAGSGCHHLAYEELYYHSPGLMNRLIEELKEGDSSRLVAALTVVSNLTVGPLTVIDRSLVESCHQHLIDATQTLLASPVVKVRLLAARANAWLYLPTHLASLVHKRIWPASLFLTDRSHHTDILSENQLHGFLLNTKYLIERFHEEKIGNSVVQQQLKQVDFKTIDQLSMANFEKISFTCRAILSELSNFNESKPANRQIEEIIATINNVSFPHHSIGMYIWTSNEIVKIINNCPLDKLVPSLYTCLIHCENEELHKACVGCLMPRASSKDFKPYANEIINILGHYVATQITNVDCTEVLEVILDILMRHKSNLAGLSASNLIAALTGDVSTYRVKIPSVRICVLSALQEVLEWDFEVAREMSYILLSYSSPSESDEDTRYNAARALTLLASPLMGWHTEDSSLIKTNIWESAITLLQDEHPRVRSEASKFASILNCNGPNEVWNPNVSLKYMFLQTTLTKYLSIEDTIRCLWSNLKCHPNELARLDSMNENSVQNPFETGISNIYAEQVKIVELSFNSLSCIISKDPNAINILPSQEIIPHLKELKEHCLKISRFYGDYLLSNGAMLNSVWYIISKKISNMYKIINYVNNTGEEKESEIFELRSLSYLEQMV